MVGEMSIDPWAKKRFQLWRITKEPPTNTPIVQYGKGNDNKITIRVVHGGNFSDFPSKSYAKTSVAYITWVNIELLDMDDFLKVWVMRLLFTDIMCPPKSIRV
ncbi:unnamed protein product [Lactuca virosa]|uniref:Uncharacterized protein n=1 Tax=Lactuca virosa TaxID=75947 RepID=A0AAU9LGY0_9ASTR|nr:unnamed protein product [Lactuca virosa]